jgi:VanZ family protein
VWCFQVLGIWLLLLMPVGAPSNWLLSGADKLVHTGLFFWLAVTALWLWRNSAIVWYLLTLAVLTELSQAVTPWRSAEILDLLADAIGIGLAWCIWRWQRQPPA